MNTLRLKFNFSKIFLTNQFNNTKNLLVNNITKAFSSEITNQNQPNQIDKEMSVREKVIANLDYKKIFNKKHFYRNFTVEDTFNRFDSYDQRDKQEMAERYKRRIYNKEYLRVHDDWQKNLLKNKIRKGIIKHNFDNYVFFNNNLLTSF